MAVADALKASPLFKGFTDTGLQILAGIATERAFPKGAPLFVENMVGDSMFVVASGTVRIASKGPGGESLPLGELGPGETLGELALLQQSQRLCTATAASAVSAVELRHADFQKLLAVKPQACIKLLMGIVTHFGQKVSDNRELIKGLIPKVSSTPKL